MSFCVYRATSGATGGAWGGQAGTSGPIGVLEGPDLFDPRGSS